MGAMRGRFRIIGRVAWRASAGWSHGFVIKKRKPHKRKRNQGIGGRLAAFPAFIGCFRQFSGAILVLMEFILAQNYIFKARGRLFLFRLAMHQSARRLRRKIRFCAD
jgi:hypothetical protein